MPACFWLASRKCTGSLPKARRDDSVIAGVAVLFIRLLAATKKCQLTLAF